jgi:hypothetical protein
LPPFGSMKLSLRGVGGGASSILCSAVGTARLSTLSVDLVAASSLRESDTGEIVLSTLNVDFDAASSWRLSDDGDITLSTLTVDLDAASSFRNSGDGPKALGVFSPSPFASSATKLALELFNDAAEITAAAPDAAFCGWGTGFLEKNFMSGRPRCAGAGGGPITGGARSSTREFAGG